MMRRGIAAVVCMLFLAGTLTPLYARPRRGRRNLHRLVDGRALSVYLDDFSSSSEKVSAEELKETLNDYLLARRKERFVITDNKETAEIIINGRLLNFIYLEKDPVDQLSGGWSGLLVDAVVVQNYARVDVEFDVVRIRDGKEIWQRKFYSTVTESNMPEPESIPKALRESVKQFVFLCFRKPKR